MSAVLVVRMMLVVLCSSCFKHVNGDLYTAVTSMEKLLKTIHRLHNTIQNYIEEEEKRLDLLKKYAFFFSAEVKKGNNDVEQYLFNPINDYILIKRLTVDWRIVRNLIFKDHSENIMTQLKMTLFPSDSDLDGAAAALIRLQDTYHLDAKSISRGELNGISYGTELRCDDSFKIGTTAYNLGYYYLMFQWMIESLRKCESETNCSMKRKLEILDYLVLSSHLTGHDLQALYFMSELFKLRISNDIIIEEMIIFKQIMNYEKSSLTVLKTDVEENIELSWKQDAPEELYMDRYEKLCRKEVQLPVRISSKLRCRYVNYDNPFLLLAPLKEEEAYPDPKILLFRQALYPSEIDIIKTIALPNFRRAEGINKYGQSVPGDFRISKVSWLNYSDHTILQKIDKRIEDMTSLTTKTAEKLQVVNYGVGGYFEPHVDNLYHQNASTDVYNDDRIATVLFYMSDVQSGGATVFTDLDLAIWPEKGTAAVWYNLYSSGNSDPRTFHAACPVLKGSKWAFNKWLHYKGNEFLRPCGKHPINHGT